MICRVRLICLLLTIIAAVSLSSFAANSYVIINDNNPTANTVSVYKLDTSNGALILAGTVETTGRGLGEGTIAVSQALTSDAHCLFAVDTQSNDIAAFASPSYKLVGRYSNRALNFSTYNRGGGIAISPNGKFVYAAYSGSENIGAWQVNPNCSLTFIAAYVPSVGNRFYAYLGVSPNGSALVVSATDFSAAESFTITSNGSLIDLGFLSFSNAANCAAFTCFPTSIDFTKDSKIVVFANDSTEPSVLTASLDTTGALTNPQEWNLPNSQNMSSANGVFLSAAAYAGSGFLYVGMNLGVVAANFTESPLSITTANSTMIVSSEGSIASIGNTMVLNDLHTLDTFRINSDGSLSRLSLVVKNNSYLLWPTIFPNRR